MKKILNHKYWWLAILVLFVAVIYGSTFFSYKVDLTAEKRFTLSNSTKNLLHNIDSTINIQVFLTGDLPADYKKLSIAVQDMLNEFRDVSGNKIQITFEQPGKNLNDSNKAKLYDSLNRFGVVFERSEDISNADEKATNQLIIPSALVHYKNYKPYAIDLRSSKTIYKNFNVVNDEPQEDKEASRNAAEALLEFKFANAIDKLTRTSVPTIAYAIGNGEAPAPKVYDLGKSISDDYKLGLFDLKQAYPNPDEINALLIVKPTQPFTEEDKLKLDQYVMHGGNIIWCIDKLYAELDSLMRSQADFIALDRGLNIDDILFKYGVRINGDLLQDLDCSKIPIVKGYNPDGSPQFVRIPWSYYPFLTSRIDNVISKNLDKVLSIFPSTIDTVKSPGIYKTILLASDTNSRVLSSPALVSLNRAIEEMSSNNFYNTYNKSYLPVSVLLEGSFTSLFANRLSKEVQDSIQRASGKAFAAQGIKPAKQIVMADADIVTNDVSKTSGPLPMGMLPLENYRFANREFFLNSVDYLVSNSGIFETRNKDFVLRLLDKKKVQQQRTTWQFINIAVPIIIILLFGGLFQWWRNQKYAV